MEHSSARPRSCLPERSPDHGASPVNMVSIDRPQPAKIRPEHLSGAGIRLRSRDTARLLLAENAFISRVAHRALISATREPGYVQSDFSPDASRVKDSLTDSRAVERT